MLITNRLNRFRNWNFQIGISLPNPSWKPSTGHDGDGSSNSSAAVTSGSFCSIKVMPVPLDSSFLSVLQKFNDTEDANSKENVTLKVLVKKFGEKGKSTLDWPSLILKAKGELIKNNFIT